MPGNRITHELSEKRKDDHTNRMRHRNLTERFRRRGIREDKKRHRGYIMDPSKRANDQIMAEAAHERHQRSMVHLTGKPENMANYEPGGPKNQHAMDDEDEFGGGRRRRTRRHRKSRRHTRKH